MTPFLRKKGAGEITTLLISHGDNDHIGGASAVIEQFNPRQILTSVPDKISHPNIETCYAGQKWQWDGVRFEILHPNKHSLLSGNNASCVLRVSSISGSVLLTGDIEKEAEALLLERRGGQIKSDVLIVPHHGSKTSSTLEFIEAVSPKYAFFPVGYKNRFGFPKQDILSRYENRGIDT